MTDSSHTRNRFLAFAFGCFSLFSLLEFFRIFVLTDTEFKNFLQLHHAFEAFSEVSRDLALGIFPIGLTIILIEYWLRSEYKKEIKDYLDSEIREIYRDRLHKLAAFESSGLVKVRYSINNEELRDFIETSNRRVFVLVPFFVEPTILEPVLKKKTNNNKFIIKIVLLHPDSIYLKRRGEVIFGNADSGKTEVIRTLRMLKRALGIARLGAVEVRTYDSLPSAFIVVSDNKALIGFHMNTGTALINPHLEVQIELDNGDLTAFGKMIDAEFKRILSDDFSQIFDLSLVP